MSWNAAAASRRLAAAGRRATGAAAIWLLVHTIGDGLAVPKPIV